MAHCDEYLELISAAVDGALSPVESKKLEAHLALCPECRALYEDLLALHAALSDLSPAEVPEGLTDRIMAAVAADNVVPLVSPAKKRSGPWRKWLASAAVLAVVIVGAWGSQNQQGGGSSAAAMPQAADAALPPQASEAALAAPEAAPASGDTNEAPQAKTVPPTAFQEYSQSDDTILEAALPDKDAGAAISSPAAVPSAVPEAPTGRMALRSAPVPQEEAVPFSEEQESAALPPATPEPATGVQPFMASAPLTNDQPEAVQTKEEAETVDNSVLLTSAGVEEPVSTPRETPIPLTKEDALDLVAEYCFGNSGYEMVREDLEGDVPSARFTLLDSAEPFTGGTIVYTGETEEVFLFECHWDDKPEEPYHYSVHKTEGYVAWQGEGGTDGEFQP